MQENPAAQSRHSTDGPGVFERFVDAINLRISRAPFFGVIVVALLAWALSKPLWGSTTKWELGLHTGSAILSLLLLVLLENASRRGQEAAQEKLNVIAEALSDLMTHHAADSEELRVAARRLREAVGLEERH
ncbi:low affinity iron permease family protein [Nocardioides nitrophenolicus]|uniref:low affinity iron permease family protein n=1 Tax=Nocardioides nitrophenolicus TaxID=60489 RepID=UPI00195DBB09|nr:low affinity iron permease family protein [Nocardioides nitrophenolicus]MBM7515804.1 low affinity Fe/Cu permease [Nocardioides nitrophenolicus]